MEKHEEKKFPYQYISLEYEDYAEYVRNLLTPEHQKELKYIKRRLRITNEKYVLQLLVRFHKSIIFSDEDNYYDILQEDYDAYLGDKEKYNRKWFEYVTSRKYSLINGDIYRTLPFFKGMKFDYQYEWLNKEVQEEYRPFINAGNHGILGRLPALKSMEAELINEAFRILYQNYKEYCGHCRTDYISKESDPYTEIGKEGMCFLYKELMQKYKK